MFVVVVVGIGVGVGVGAAVGVGALAHRLQQWKRKHLYFGRLSGALDGRRRSSRRGAETASDAQIDLVEHAVSVRNMLRACDTDWLLAPWCQDCQRRANRSGGACG